MMNLHLVCNGTLKGSRVMRGSQLRPRFNAWRLLESTFNRRAREPQELDRRVSGIDVRMRHDVIGPDHVRHSGMLNPQLSPQKCQAVAINGRPDFLLAWIVRMRLTHRQGDRE